MDRVFLDTNVLVYAYAPTDMSKREIAVSAILNHDCFISTQVINEFCAVCAHKRRLEPSMLSEALNQIDFFCKVASLKPMRCARSALAIHDRYGFHFYDSNIIAAAVECGCRWLFSEDMSDGQQVGATVIKNIFV